MAGYNIVCDPGDLYNRKCYTINPDTGAKEEIMGYTSSGDPVSKGASGSSWMAWIPSLTSLTLQGDPYKPYGEAGIPYILGGGSAVGGIMAATGADPQDAYYLDNVMPGSFSRKMYNKRVCNPLWPTFGCKVGNMGEKEELEDEPKPETFLEKIKYLFSAEEDKTDWKPYALGSAVLVGGIIWWLK